MGARWNWDAVCPNGHVYGNFSGGADECYTCGADPEAVFEGDDSGADARAYAERRRAGESVADIQAADEVEILRALAEKHGFTVAVRE